MLSLMFMALHLSGLMAYITKWRFPDESENLFFTLYPKNKKTDADDNAVKKAMRKKLKKRTNRT